MPIQSLRPANFADGGPGDAATASYLSEGRHVRKRSGGSQMSRTMGLAIRKDRATRLRFACLLAWGLVSLGGISPAHANSAALQATSDDGARKEAIDAIPWRQLGQAEQRAVQHIVHNASIYRRMPTRVIDCDPELFNFLGQNPEVVTEVWRMMGVCNLRLERAGPDIYRVTDTDGSAGTVRFLETSWNEGAQNSALIYTEGTYHGKPFPRAIKARSISLLRSGSVVETNGRPYITARLDSFVLIDRLGVELVAKTVQPLLVSTADHNFSETMKFVATFSKTAETNPAGMQRLADKLDTLRPETRAGMVSVCHSAAQRYRALTSRAHDSQLRLVDNQSVAEASP